MIKSKGLKWINRLGDSEIITEFVSFGCSHRKTILYFFNHIKRHMLKLISHTLDVYKKKQTPFVVRTTRLFSTYNTEATVRTM
jgi:hypothetical protein